jgi:hypothetical protein
MRESGIEWRKAVREADAADCHLWSEQMEGFGGPAQASPTIACLNGGYGWLEAKCKRCETSASGTRYSPRPLFSGRDNPGMTRA